MVSCTLAETAVTGALSEFVLLKRSILEAVVVVAVTMGL